MMGKIGGGEREGMKVLLIKLFKVVKGYPPPPNQRALPNPQHVVLVLIFNVFGQLRELLIVETSH